MKTIHYLTDPGLRGLFLPGVIAAAALGLMCSLLSVAVVLKRLAFVGQGISHAAFGGIGVAAFLGVTATTTSAAPHHGVPQFLVVFAFCLGAAVLVGMLSGRGAMRADAVIGIVLVASMALGAILLAASKVGLEWEGFLFGSLSNVNETDAWIAWGIAAGTVAAVWWTRRALVFWAFDEGASRAFGVQTSSVRLLLMVLLALATVVSMKLAGVVLATALLVMPGAIALKLSETFSRVMALSVAAGLASIAAGLVLSFEADWPPGPSIVCVLTVLYAGAHGAWAVNRRTVRA